MGPVESPPRVSIPRRRGRRSAWVTTPAFRLIVPVVLGGLGLLAAGIAVLAAAVLLGWLPYPGR